MDEFKKLLDIDFSQCKLEQLDYLNIKNMYPLPLIKLEDSELKTKRVLALISKEAYENYREILYQNYVLSVLEDKSYICPDYYNGEWITKNSKSSTLYRKITNAI